MSKTIRVGVIGTGGIARTHVNALKEIPGVEITALADVKAEIVAKFKADMSLDKAAEFSDWKKLVADKNVDAVTICTPNGLHKDNVIGALKAGKHALVEKPLAMNVKEGKAMCDAAKLAKKSLTIGFQQRFRPDIQYIARLVKDGVIGDVVYCRTQYLRRRGIPPWGVFINKELQGGGPMIDIGVHALDMAHYICGKPEPLTASGMCYTYLGNKKPEVKPPWGEWDWTKHTVEDLAVGFLRFKGGVSMTVESSFAAHIEETDLFRLQVMGTKGGALIGDGIKGAKVFADVSGAMVNMNTAYLPGDDCFKTKMKNWIAVCRGEMQNDAPGEDGLMIQRLLDGVYESSEKGKEVDISK